MATTESALTQMLLAWPNSALEQLLELRPDLATPAPSTLTALASRAATQASTDRALARLDAPTLAVAESLVALAALSADPRDAIQAQDVSAAVGFDARTALDALVARALVTPSAPGNGSRTDDEDHPGDPSTKLATTTDIAPTTALTQAWGAYPAGLGPTLPHPLSQDPLALLATAPQDARRIVEALAWGPPVGALASTTATPAPALRAPGETTSDGATGSGVIGSRSSGAAGAAVTTTPKAPVAPGVLWLLDNGLLLPGEKSTVVLPGVVGLAVREGRTHRDVTLAAPIAPAPQREDATVAAESTHAAQEIDRLVLELLTLWRAEPPPLLRSGGLGARELRRASAVLQCTIELTAFVVELAGATGLLGRARDGLDPVWAPTLAAGSHADLGLHVRWARLARAWSRTPRAPWLVGARGANGQLISALGPGLERPWTASARRRLLAALNSWPRGGAPSPEEVRRWWAWHTPRSTPPVETIRAIAREASWIGVTGAGALADAGRALVEAWDDEDAEHAVAAALDADLPTPVDEMLLQGDLTGMVPGRPTPALAGLLARMADVESRGSALTVRFTPGSIRRALDAGDSGPELVDALRKHSRTGLPQPLEYAILDVARKHGGVRAGSATSYLRAEDPGVLDAILADSSLRRLGLRALAPTVLIADAPAAEVAAAVAHHGLTPVLEGPDGAALPVATTWRHDAAVDSRGRPRAHAPIGAAGSSLDEPEARPVRTRRATPDELVALVARMRAAESLATARSAGSRGGAVEDPAHVLSQLREAAAANHEVWLSVAAGNGAVQRRRVRPLTVDAGRVRVVDTARESEITFPAHRIVAVAPTRA